MLCNYKFCNDYKHSLAFTCINKYIYLLYNYNNYIYTCKVNSQCDIILNLNLDITS